MSKKETTIEIGDVVRVLNGFSPPCDGTIVSSAETLFDESSLTGEAKPVKKGAGDQVFLGTINKSKVVDVRVDTVAGTTMLDRIIDVVREGHTRRAPIERVADAVTGVFVPIVTLLAITTWVVWVVLGYSGALPDDYLDIEVGGWSKSHSSFPMTVLTLYRSGVVPSVRCCSLRGCLSMWYWSRSPDCPPCWFWDSRPTWYSCSWRGGSVPGNGPSRHRGF